jgi:hypothetical protein
MNQHPSPRAFGLGDTIPGHGIVVRTSDTAYQVESGNWVPFYGPRGVDPVVAYQPLVVLR